MQHKMQGFFLKIAFYFVYENSFVETFKFSLKKAPKSTKVNQIGIIYMYIILIQFEVIWSYFEGELESFNEEIEKIYKNVHF